MARVLLSLGANLGHKAGNVRKAMDIVCQWQGATDFKLSPLYITKPWGYKDQDDFINSAMSFESDLDPHEMLARIHAIEDKFKRRRLFRYGPRTIDIDIICVGDLTMDTLDLAIPHPKMSERAFVLLPLDAIEPDFPVPGLGRTVHELVASLPVQETDGVRVLDES